jgi:hypothetical protein
MRITFYIVFLMMCEFDNMVYNVNYSYFLHIIPKYVRIRQHDFLYQYKKTKH